MINYNAFKFVTDLNKFKKTKYSEYVTKIITLYKKAPFVSLFIAALTPIPFYPFRFLVVLAHYPMQKYVLAVFLARFLRFMILAVVGHAFDIPDKILVLSFICLIIMINGPVLIEVIRARQARVRSGGV